MELAIIITLIVIGIVFILLELFFIPGVTIASLGGVGCLVAAVILAYKNIGPTAGNITLILALVATIAAIWWFFHSRTLDKMALDSEIDSKVVSQNGSDGKVAPGDKGICLSRLAPSGKILVNGVTLEGHSETGMIDEGSEIEVIRIESYRVIVKRTNL